MQQVREFTADEIKKWDVLSDCGDGSWSLARPEGYHYGGLLGFVRRVKLALKVFTGRADVLTWYKQ